jgi:hypothetical protein
MKRILPAFLLTLALLSASPSSGGGTPMDLVVTSTSQAFPLALSNARERPVSCRIEVRVTYEQDRMRKFKDVGVWRALEPKGSTQVEVHDAYAQARDHDRKVLDLLAKAEAEATQRHRRAATFERRGDKKAAAELRDDSRGPTLLSIACSNFRGQPVAQNQPPIDESAAKPAAAPGALDPGERSGTFTEGAQ